VIGASQEGESRLERLKRRSRLVDKVLKASHNLVSLLLTGSAATTKVEVL
jgi:hypothetical protein